MVLRRLQLAYFAASLVALATTVTPRDVGAQSGVCRPAEDSNEAKLLAFFATPIAFSPSGTIEPLGRWDVRVAFDASYVPSPSREIQQPEACYNIRKTENTDLSPVFPRPRVAVGLPGGLVLEGSYLPPLTVADAQANIGSVALTRAWRITGNPIAGGLDVALRAHGTVGWVRGAITCPEENLQQDNAAEACFGSRPSRDTYEPNMFGFEGILARRAADDRWGAYAGAGATWLRPRFQVGFRYEDGGFDDTKIRVNLQRAALLAGAHLRLPRGAAIMGELYSVPTDATTGRIGAAYTFR